MRRAMVAGDRIVPTYGKRTTDVLKHMLRPAIIPQGNKSLVIADWAAIEARVNPWLTNSVSGDGKLDLFRTGADVYKANAVATFGGHIDDVADAQRQVGKVQELACGFGGGVGAFAAMGRAYGVRLPEADARRMVDAWRRANPWAVQFWSDLERAYMSAMYHKGHEYTAGRITYLFDGQHLWYALPSGRILCYPYARLEDGNVTYAKASWKPAADATEWPRARLWKGLACENCWSGDTRLITSSGVKRIQDVSILDRIWDGDAWVTHDGVSHNGTQEVVEWAGQHVTPSHRIFDGSQWKTVMSLDEHTSDGCLNWAQSLVVSQSWLATGGQASKGLSWLCASAGVRYLLKSARFEKVRAVAQNAVQRNTSSGVISYATGDCGIYGCTGVPARYPDALTPTTKRGLITVGGVSKSTNRGLKTAKSGCSTRSRFHDGMCLGLTWTASTTMGTTRPATFVSCLAVRMSPTAAAPCSLKPKENECLSVTSARSIVRGGPAITLWRTTFRKAEQAMKSPRITGLRLPVYDVLNCGPRNRYVVVTALGPVVAHNCTQATANDLLRNALRLTEDGGLETVLSVHDEIVLEADDPDTASARLIAAMTTPPTWAAGLPLNVEVSVKTRYGKD